MWNLLSVGSEEVEVCNIERHSAGNNFRTASELAPTSFWLADLPIRAPVVGYDARCDMHLAADVTAGRHINGYGC